MTNSEGEMDVTEKVISVFEEADVAKDQQVEVEVEVQKTTQEVAASLKSPTTPFRISEATRRANDAESRMNNQRNHDHKKGARRVKVKVDRLELASTTPSPMSSMITIDYNKVMERYSFIQEGKMYVFKVNHVVSPNLFYMEYLADRLPNEFQTDMRPDTDGRIKPSFWLDLQYLYEMVELRERYALKTEPVKKRWYACKDVNNWERIDVVSKESSTRQADVLFIDLGTRKWVDWDDMYELAPIFIDPPGQAFRSHLDIIPNAQDFPDWSAKAMTYFREMVLGKRVQAVINKMAIDTFEGTIIPQCSLCVSLYVLKDKPSPGGPYFEKSVQAEMVSGGFAVASRSIE